MNTAMK